MHILLSISLLFLLSGCVVTKSSMNDFSIKGTGVQEIPVDDAKILQVRCYCPEISLKRTGSEFIQLTIEAVLSSSGYHGKQVKPTEIAPSALSFALNRVAETLEVESYEHTYMHHTFLVQTLVLIVPPDVEVRIVQIPYRELEERGRPVEQPIKK